ncbi:MAG: L-alanine exporter AlaE [Clostridia bacterium]|nr:L-alanine exporter AlaE [Clostridia bacterium]
MIKNIWSRSRNNIIATIIYGSLTYCLIIFYERYLLNLNWHDLINVRIIYLTTRYFFLFILDWLIDFYRHFLSKFIADAISLLTYQLPLYAGAALIVGIDYDIILLALAIYAVDNLLLGWLYGFILDQTRKYFLQKAL